MKWPITQLTTLDGTQVSAQAPFIISASRATDIPAFYGDWLVEGIKNGYIIRKNPYSRVFSYISFKNARLFVFWSKNPKPFLKYLDFFDSHSYNYYFQFTLNNYEKENFEPFLPSLRQRIETFIELSQRIGKEKVIWRFDPVFITKFLSIDEIIDRIAYIGERLKNYTEKLVFSFVDIKIYKKVERNLNKQNIPYIEFDDEKKLEFAEKLYKLNKNLGLQLATCGEEFDLEIYGIKHNKCIDDELILKLFSKDNVLMDFLGIRVENDLFETKNFIFTRNLKDQGQRKYCKCIISKDIGEYNTCRHGCVYCYACHYQN